MQLLVAVAAILLAVTDLAQASPFYKEAVCTSDGTRLTNDTVMVPGWRNWILTNATRCACDLYQKRKTGVLQNDMCPDCVFNPTTATCYSKHWHMGAVEFNSYCVHYCNATGWEGKT